MEGPGDLEGEPKLSFGSNILYGSSSVALNQFFRLQMVQNGEHKCTKKSQPQSAEDKTVCNDGVVFSEVLFCLTHGLYFHFFH